MLENKNVRIAFISESQEGSASVIIPEICKDYKNEIVGVIYCERAIKKNETLNIRKIKKVLKIGVIGAFLGIYMRKWYRQDIKKYLNKIPLDILSDKLKLPYFKTIGLNSIETRELLTSLNVDLAISLGNSYISSRVFNIPKFGMINAHHELLPEYQNAQSIIWQLYNKSRLTGYTIHKITKKIDDGPILFRSQRDLIFKDSLGETVSFNYAKSIVESSKGIIYAIELLIKREFESHQPPYLAEKGHYTTPSMSSFIRIYRNWLHMKKINNNN